VRNERILRNLRSRFLVPAPDWARVAVPLLPLREDVEGVYIMNKFFVTLSYDAADVGYLLLPRFSTWKYGGGRQMQFAWLRLMFSVFFRFSFMPPVAEE
jgi:hypothetical protein